VRVELVERPGDSCLGGSNLALGDRATAEDPRTRNNECGAHESWIVMFASIIITSYNYGRFLRQAIESCLNQTYADTEIIVVDDSSTDGSRHIIESYGRSLISVFKENGGHSSAINAGFSVSHGDIICPLDSDDVFTTDKVARVVEAWKPLPHVNLLYHQLQTIDANGVQRGNPWPRSTLSGDIHQKIAQTAGWWPRPTTSGLCFSRSYLERVLPMPTGPRIWPDTYLAPPAAFMAPVIGLPIRLGYYRTHGENTIDKFFPKRTVPSERREVARQRVAQYVNENVLLVDCIHGLLDAPPDVALGGHPEFQSVRRAAGEPVSLWELASVFAQCPAMPAPMKLRSVVLALLAR